MLIHYSEMHLMSGLATKNIVVDASNHQHRRKAKYVDYMFLQDYNAHYIV